MKRKIRKEGGGGVAVWVGERKGWEVSLSFEVCKCEICKICSAYINEKKFKKVLWGNTLKLFAEGGKQNVSSLKRSK